MFFSYVCVLGQASGFEIPWHVIEFFGGDIPVLTFDLESLLDVPTWEGTSMQMVNFELKATDFKLLCIL